MADITYIPDHEAQAQARLVDQFRNSVRVQALIGALVAPVQDLELVLVQLQQERALGTAIGTQLDTLGAIVGQQREGRDDETYRLWIAARALVNRSNGHIDELLEIAALVASEATRGYDETIGSYTLTLLGLLADPVQIYQILLRAKPAGVGFHLVSSPAGVGLFTLDNDTTLTTSTTEGLGDTTDGSIGGIFVSAI